VARLMGHSVRVADQHYFRPTPEMERNHKFLGEALVASWSGREKGWIVRLIEIRRAIQRIEHGRPKRISKDRCRLNISTVAREASITAASIHNTYPDIAEAIRAKAGRASWSTLDAERLERKRLAELLRLTRERLKAAERDVRRIASEKRTSTHAERGAQGQMRLA